MLSATTSPASWCSLALATSFVASFAAADVAPLTTCQQLAAKVSKSSLVTYPGALSFAGNIHHWFDSSTQIPTCVLDIGAAQDMSTAMQIIGANRTPFALKSGGHASNPGFSSTKGVHIVFNGMKQVTLSPDKSTVEIGMGLTWADVYKTLTPSGVNVVGGRTTGPGVGGFTLGGGYSWKTNQHGLTSDSVKAYNLVLPNGTATRVDASSSPDLFFALKGGLNRFGALTSAEYYTHPQPPQVYAGIATYGSSDTAAVVNATHAFFTDNTDPKAQIITTLEAGSTGPSALVLFFYDGPTRPASFSGFDALKPSINTVKTQSFSDFVSGIPATIQMNARGTFHSLSTSQLTPGFLAAVVNETSYWGKQMLAHGGTTVSYDVEPFLPDYGTRAVDSAFPHKDSPLPLNLYFGWLGSANDAYWYAAMRASVAHLKTVAQAEGIYPSDYTVYPNYAISGTSAADLYGAGNAGRLARVRDAVDPGRVMELAGGFDI